MLQECSTVPYDILSWKIKEIYLWCVFHYLINEWNNKKQTEREDQKDRKLKYCAGTYLGQNNGKCVSIVCHGYLILIAMCADNDCGVFICIHVEFLIENLPLTFN